MFHSTFLLALFFNLICCAGLQNSATTRKKDCCNARTVLGTSAKSGTYHLKDENDPRCPDGCLYSKGDLDVCFKANYKYVASCDQITTTSTTTTSTSTSKEVVVTTKSHIEFWKMNKTHFEPKTISNKGIWGDDEFCPEGSYADSFQLYVAEMCSKRCKLDDDVALLGIRLYCVDYADPTTTTGTISSAIMDPCGKQRGKGECSWMPVHSCPKGQFTWKSKFLSEFYHDFQTTGAGAAFTCPPGIICRDETIVGSDPVGGMNLDMGCTDGIELTGDGIDASQVPLGPNDEVTTFWSPWTECPTGYAICGFRSKVGEGETDGSSNMGLTAVIFHCCQLPPDFKK